MHGQFHAAPTVTPSVFEYKRHQGRKTPKMLISFCLLFSSLAAKPVEDLRTYAISETERVQMTEAEALLRSMEDPDFNFVDVTDGGWDELELGAQSSLVSPVYPTIMTMSTQVSNMIASVDRTYVQSFLEGFTSFRNRYYRSTFGVQSAEFLYQELESIRTSSSRSDIKVSISKFVHSSWGQFSLIARVESAFNSTEDAVILGAHQDSINRVDAMNGVAPGVDDDATGVVTNLAVLKALIAATEFVPRRPIELHFYAGEEGGLKGSQEIVGKYVSSKRQVYGMLQTDMTVILIN